SLRTSLSGPEVMGVWLGGALVRPWGLGGKAAVTLATWVIVSVCEAPSAGRFARKAQMTAGMKSWPRGNLGSAIRLLIAVFIGMRGFRALSARLRSTI